MKESRIPRLALILLACAAAVIGLEALTGTPEARRDRTVARRAPTPLPRPAAGTESRCGPEAAEPEAELVPDGITAAPAPPAVEVEPPEPTSLALTRIVHDADDPEATFAVISGRAVRAGDSIAGLDVVRVERDRVRLSDERELTLEPGKGEK